MAVLRKDGGEFNTNPANVAAQRDFYKLPRLRKADLEFIHSFINRLPQSEERKEVARGWLRAPEAAARMRRFLMEQGALTTLAEQEIEAFEIEADEGMMTAIEHLGQPYVELLRAGNTTFWPLDEKACIDFSWFISVQHMRTKRMADLVAMGQPPLFREEIFKRTWPILKHILAANIGGSLYVQRKEFNLRIIRAGCDARFITSDQPIINLVPAINDNDLALYFPVSPTTAMLMEHIEIDSQVPEDANISDDIVQYLNGRMFDGSHEQIIGTNIDHLKNIKASYHNSAAAE